MPQTRDERRQELEAMAASIGGEQMVRELYMGRNANADPGPLGAMIDAILDREFLPDDAT